MRGVFSAVEMTLVLNVVGSVSPTEFTTDGSLLHCEGLNNQSYICDSGHCCGESKCCSYYYELWWFWLVWAIILILSCCCICHHRRTKHRLQQQQRQHEINLIAYREAHNYTSVPFYFRFLPNYLLPDYEEVVNRPLTPPPPYSALHTVSSTLPSGPLSGEQQESHCPAVQSSPAAPDSDALRPRPGLEDADPARVGFFLPKLADKPPHAAPYPGTITRSDAGAGSEKGERGDAGDSRKEPMPPEPEGRAEEKRLLPVAGGRRRRRFTGDSGIEVCVCGARGPSGGGARELKELESLLGCTEDEDEDEDDEEADGGGGEFCESCGPRARFGDDEEEGEGEGQAREEPQRGADQLPSADPQPAHQTSSSSSSSISSSNAPPVCALMHTINEQEGPHHGNEPQGCSQ